VSYLLDTNACIQYLNGKSPHLHRKLEAQRPDQNLLCSVVKAELFYGAVKSAQRVKNVRTLHMFFNRFLSLPFDDQSAITYGTLRVGLERSGALIGPNDLLIAAIALTNQLTLVTHNTREFGRISNLVVEDWETD
jgi:tRNA(fMet)-specific endonuclease VapC